jgi:hypothetical protein
MAGTLKKLRERFPPGRLALGAVGLAVGIGGVLALREATLSTHGEPVGPEIELVVAAEERGSEPGQSLAEIVRAQIQTCRLEVTSDVVGSVDDLGDGRFRAVLRPSMDLTNRKQFRGCMEDWVIDHVRINVVHLDEPDRTGGDEADDEAVDDD